MQIIIYQKENYNIQSNKITHFLSLFSATLPLDTTIVVSWVNSINSFSLTQKHNDQATKAQTMCQD